jgi:hypothetical protein
MFKVALTALIALPLTFASAQAFDNVNVGVNRAAAGFAQFGLQGMAAAGRPSADWGIPQFGYAGETFAGAPAYAPYAPTCWTRYVTVANGNTLVNMPYTICR